MQTNRAASIRDARSGILASTYRVPAALDRLSLKRLRCAKSCRYDAAVEQPRGRLSSELGVRLLQFERTSVPSPAPRRPLPDTTNYKCARQARRRECSRVRALNEHRLWRTLVAALCSHLLFHPPPHLFEWTLVVSQSPVGLGCQCLGWRISATSAMGNSRISLCRARLVVRQIPFYKDLTILVVNQVSDYGHGRHCGA